MNLRTKSAVIFAAVIACITVCSSGVQADWIKVQDNPITIYRDTRTGLEWSVTISSAGNNNANARNIVQQYGLRLPTWDELRDVVNNNDAIDWLEIEDGLLDLYETSDPNVLAGAFGGSISTRRPRQAITRTWVVGVRRAGSGNTPQPPQPTQPTQTQPISGGAYYPENGDRIIYVNNTLIRDEDHFREVIRYADTRIILTLVDHRTGNTYRMMTDLLPKGSTTRLGIYIQNDSRGGVVVTGVMAGTPGMRCRYVGSGSGNLPIPSTPPQNPTNVGKLYVLTVWGTNAGDIGESEKIFMGEFRMKMTFAGIGSVNGFNNVDPAHIPIDPVTNQKMDKVNFLAEYNELSGANASNANVLRKCREISQKAQKNDVIFVYISCHGNTMNLYGDNRRYHVLFPGIVGRNEINRAENGITRSAIIQALNPDNHRLTVLITDTCTERTDEWGEKGNINIACDAAPALAPFHISNLWLLLRTNTGFINWSSTSPFGGVDEDGEYSVIIPTDAPIGNPESVHSGGVFDSAFSSYAFKQTSKDNISKSEFFSNLRNVQHEVFQEKIQGAKNNASRRIREFLEKISSEQDTQTLFDFRNGGYVTD